MLPCTGAHDSSGGESEEVAALKQEIAALTAKLQEVTNENLKLLGNAASSHDAKIEDDDDFEEFENDDVDYDAIINKGGDVEMNDGNDGKAPDDFDLKMWHNDWDDVDDSEDYIGQLRAEIK